MPLKIPWHHGVNLRGFLLLLFIEQLVNLGECVHLNARHLRFRGGVLFHRGVDLVLLAAGYSLGDGETSLFHLILNGRGFLLRVVHDGLHLLLLVFIEFQDLVEHVHAAHAARCIIAASAAFTAPVTALALREGQRRCGDSNDE